MSDIIISKTAMASRKMWIFFFKNWTPIYRRKPMSAIKPHSFKWSPFKHWVASAWDARPGCGSLVKFEFSCLLRFHFCFSEEVELFGCFLPLARRIVRSGVFRILRFCECATISSAMFRGCLECCRFWCFNISSDVFREILMSQVLATNLMFIELFFLFTTFP